MNRDDLIKKLTEAAHEKCEGMSIEEKMEVAQSCSVEGIKKVFFDLKTRMECAAKANEIALCLSKEEAMEAAENAYKFLDKKWAEFQSVRPFRDVLDEEASVGVPQDRR